jgi:hypothetical protein
MRHGALESGLKTGPLAMPGVIVLLNVTASPLSFGTRASALDLVERMDGTDTSSSSKGSICRQRDMDRSRAHESTHRVLNKLRCSQNAVAMACLV